MDVEVSFGRWLEKRRKALDLTREELAQKVGCSVSALRKVESNERHPSKQLAELLAFALEILEDERPVFLRAARGERLLDRLRAPVPLPDLDPFQSSKTLSSSIPVPLTQLIGRETDLAALSQMLNDPQCRLITLVGPGGSGKTRLAIEIVRVLDNVFKFGAIFVPLAGINSIGSMFPAIANAMGFEFDVSIELKKQLFNHLRQKQIILVLDNLEHLLDGIGILGEMVEYAPQLKVLSTSREQLNLHGEWVFEVKGLRVPASEKVEKLADYSAVALFLECARRTRNDFKLKAENQFSIIRICQLVEGMPLAIELAASWVRSLSCQEIAEEIERGLAILAAPIRGLPERHQSMQAVFDHSWKLLSKEERNVLMRLSIFRGGFTREMAEQVTGTDLGLLSALVAKSLVRRSLERRYSLHELVQQYAFAQLSSLNKVEKTRSAHLKAYIQLAERIEPELTHGEQYRWLEYLETEHDNFRAALSWSFDSEDATSSLELTGALWRFWFMRSYFVEGSQWLERALQIIGNGATPTLRAKALTGAGLLAYYQNDFDQAKSKLEECLALQSYLSEHDIAYAQMTIGFVVHDQLDFERASLLYREALQRFRRLNDSYGIIRSLNSQGVLSFDMGDLNTAASLFHECLVLAREHQDKGNIALATTNLGWTAAIRGNGMAINLCQEAMLLYRELGNKLGIAFCLEGIGAGYAHTGQCERAVQLIGAANVLRKAIAAPSGGTHARCLETMIQRARNSLPEEIFASAWAEGEAMSLEQAIEFALDG